MNRPFAIIAFNLILLACGNADPATVRTAADKDSTQATAPATEAAYACPMHPEVTGKKGDTCPKCGMDLEPINQPPQR